MSAVEPLSLTAAPSMESTSGSFTADAAPRARRPAVTFPVSDIVQGTFDFMPATLAGYLAGIAIIVLLYWQEAAHPVMGAWLAAFAVVWLLRAWSAYRFQQRVRPQDSAAWERWRLGCNVATLASGAMWGAAGWVFYPLGERIQEIGLLIVIYSFCLAAVPVLATQPRIYLAFATLCFAPLGMRITMEGRAYGAELIAILFVVISLTTVLTRRYRQAMERVLELKLQADGLLSQLRLEKQAADAARREAEVANRAKTQFFTAASHDLRQPLHAMGLFAEALRQKNHDDEVAQLVNSINASVDALEELFSELLDITRIDSGGVAVQPQHVAIGDIFRKLRLHFEPTAFEKGLALRFRGAQHMLYADPLLVERVLRNLVSNAIRYTDDGAVLVSCRRRGERLQLQVWDTGVGIDEPDQLRVFEEFYQVPQVQPSPHQRKGLGLGLAIVKRLCGLMEAPLTVRSTPGRGTVFTLTLPPGKAMPAAHAAVPGKAPLALTLHGRLVVVVEDEPAVRCGIDALLRGWGATVLAFDTVAACRAWADHADAHTPRPDLLIVDYRLEHGRTGVEAIELLRHRFGASLPAIMVTGSTMTGHDEQAQAMNFHLLIKPVVPNKLRAMIAFKLGARVDARRGAEP